ncbi:hypothetical protein P692DRAFT_20841322 [Suillus brevipes Sb2]|nr:hypothetical protein P692DRAFT_20841322 [Suillus brevipes Sb2]
MRRLYHHLIIGTCRGEFPGAVTRVVGELSRSLWMLRLPLALVSYSAAAGLVGACSLGRIQMDATSGGQKCWPLTSVFVLPSLLAYLKPFVKSV